MTTETIIYAAVVGTLIAEAISVALLLALVLTRDVRIASIALRDAPEPHWSEIRTVLINTGIVGKTGLRIAERMHPPTSA